MNEWDEELTEILDADCAEYERRLAEERIIDL